MAHAIGYCFIESKAGSAWQMNKGAALATGNVLLFLHSDTRLPANATESIEQKTGNWRYWRGVSVEKIAEAYR